ncbi:MAG: hypothetical protein M1814_000806 [Vezdaea aestivalis]|nr:MAG: hypothetical protein M1814_000806 [Vezdaea aestivalis]
MAAPPSPSQLLLLADHIKLSLLERSRAISLDLSPGSQDGHISRSLSTLQDGVEALEQGSDKADLSTQETTTRLRAQLNDLSAQFNQHSDSTPRSANLTTPNDPALQSSFTAAQTTRPVPKSVRFSDNPAAPSSDPDYDPNREALLPYRDDPSPPDQSALSNQQVHAYHSEVLEEQDRQLDRLGESIGRQRELSIQIGDELDGQVALLDEVDEHTDRQRGRLDGARRRLGGVARKAKDNKQLTAIFVLIVILVFLIVILK